MTDKKPTLWLDIAFIVIGVITLLLLFLPRAYAGYRIAGYVGAGVFVLFMLWREVRRRCAEKEGVE